MKLAITTAILNPSPTRIAGAYSGIIGRCVESQTNTCETNTEPRICWNYLDDNLGVTGSLQWLYQNTTADIIAFLHSDLEIFEQGWDERVLAEFEDPRVGVVGFGGGRRHGSEDIYKIPYSLGQLARFDYLSNTSDAEHHGKRFTGSCEVAVLDGFALIVRRGLLDQLGGWPVKELPFHCYDYWTAIAAHKLGMSVRLVGIECQHYSGQTANTPAYQDWSVKHLGISDAEVHTQSHKVIYEMGREVLPWRVK